MKMPVNEKAEKVLMRVKGQLDQRKAPKDALMSVVSNAILKMPKSFWDEQIQEQTPVEFLLSEAISDPKLSKEIAEFLRSRHAGAANEPSKPMVEIE